MSTESGKAVIPKFPLRLMPTIRSQAQTYSEKEGVSLNQFINVAVAQRLAHLQHEEWAQRRKPITAERLAEARVILDSAGTDEVIPGDELPPGYTPRRVASRK